MTIEKVIFDTAHQESPSHHTVPPLRRRVVAPRKRPQPSHPRRGLTIALTLVTDVLLASGLLCLFALSHHVLPQNYDTNVPVNPPSIDIPAADGTLTEMEKNFEEHFVVEPVMTENSYYSKNVLMTVTKHTQGSGKNTITYYVADIRLRSIESFRTAFADDTYGRGISDTVPNLSKKNNALLAISGDYYGLHNSGPVIRNGVLYRSKRASSDVCVLYRDGTMKTFPGKSFDAEAEMENGAWQCWSFGPNLLNEDGTAATSFTSNLSIVNKHPRCAIGYYEPGHYAFVLVDGRDEGYSEGMTMKELAKLFETMGCRVAYNLDGGRTAMMMFDHDIVNQPYLGGREVSDIVYIGEVD